MSVPVTIKGDAGDKLMSGTLNLTTTNLTQITANSIPLFKGVQLQAGANAGVVYFGDYSITANVAQAHCGYPLSANATEWVPVDDLSKVYFKAATENDIVHWFAI
jgi:hypothetical protein